MQRHKREHKGLETKWRGSVVRTGRYRRDKHSYGSGVAVCFVLQKINFGRLLSNFANCKRLNCIVHVTRLKPKTFESRL